jgi:hypothetical protein
MKNSLKGQSYENVCEIIALNDRLDSNLGPRPYFNFLKWPLIFLGFLKLAILLNKMGSLYLEDVATSRLQICGRGGVFVQRHAVVRLGQ